MEVNVKAAKILVVDDSKLLHKMYEVMLRGVRLVYACDGQDALGCLGAHADIDLILLDINMPRMNGLEFLGHVKADPRWKRIPVIIVSTEGREADTKRGLDAGAAAYVRKPFQADTLASAIASLPGVST
jgi:two-component system chemotaxis response regulator CheY